MSDVMGIANDLVLFEFPPCRVHRVESQGEDRETP